MDTGDLPTMHIPLAHQPYGGTDDDSPIADRSVPTPAIIWPV